jgi:hypothetical protein
VLRLPDGLIALFSAIRRASQTRHGYAPRFPPAIRSSARPLPAPAPGEAPKPPPCRRILRRKPRQQNPRRLQPNPITPDFFVLPNASLDLHRYHFLYPDPRSHRASSFFRTEFRLLPGPRPRRTSHHHLAQAAGETYRSRGNSVPRCNVSFMIAPRQFARHRLTPLRLRKVHPLLHPRWPHHDKYHSPPAGGHWLRQLTKPTHQRCAAPGLLASSSTALPALPPTLSAMGRHRGNRFPGAITSESGSVHREARTGLYRSLPSMLDIRGRLLTGARPSLNSLGCGVTLRAKPSDPSSTSIHYQSATRANPHNNLGNTKETRAPKMLWGCADPEPRAEISDKVYDLLYLCSPELKPGS